ncbi:hypothetical protein DJ82_13800 [Halorubrum sp. Ib24]|nr:hypothetical protein DJ82_13800 [Halorubrum sp. Ib24]
MGEMFNNILLCATDFIKSIYHRLNAHFAILTKFVACLVKEFFLFLERNLRALSFIKRWRRQSKC